MRHGARGLSIAVALAALMLCAPAAAGPDDGTAAGSRHYKTGELLVKFRAGSPGALRHASHAALSARAIREFVSLGIHHVAVTEGHDIEEALSAYRADPSVEYAEPNYRITALTVLPNDPLFSRQWGLFNTGQTGGRAGADIDAPGAWEITRGSDKVVVAVIDSGLDYDHPDIADNLWVNPSEHEGEDGRDDDGDGFADDFHGYNTTENSGNIIDDYGHGTHVAGIIGGRANNGAGTAGVNWNVRILPCKALAADGTGYVDKAIECLEYVRIMKRRGVNIVATNNSWGVSQYSQALYDAIDAQRDILFVTSAGNSRSDNDRSASYPARYGLPNIIAVAATDHNDQLAVFSNFGRRTVHVGAPGVDVVSLRADVTDMSGDPARIVSDRGEAKYYLASGTSMAAPFVTGLAALIKAQDPSRDTVKIRNLILSGGQVIPSLKDKTITGRRINALGSLTCVSRPLLSVLESPAAIQRGVPAKLAALSINCASAAGPVTVTTDTGETVVLHDDGADPDIAAGDGVFSAHWTPQTDPLLLTFTSPSGTETVRIPLILVSETLPAAKVGDAYRADLQATGGKKPYAWSLASGALPEGLNLDRAAGTLWGTPSREGQFNFTVTVTDADAPAGRVSKEYSLSVYSRPDLVVTSVTAAAAVRAGEQMQVTVRVRNQAAGTSAMSRTVIYLSRGAPSYQTDTRLGFIDASILVRSQEQTLTGTFTVPPGLPSGDYYIAALADAYSWVDESDETNNGMTGNRVTVTGPPPDLVPVALSGPQSASAGDTINVVHTVRNKGAGTSGPTRAAVYLSTDPGASGTGALLGYSEVPPLGPGTELTVSTLLTVPLDLRPGTYSLSVAEDIGDAEAETDETNNRLTKGQIRISAPGSSVTAPDSLCTATVTSRQRISVPAVRVVSNLYWIELEYVPTSDGELWFMLTGAGPSSTAGCRNFATLAQEGEVATLRIPLVTVGSSSAWGVLGFVPTADGTFWFRVLQAGLN